MRKKADKKSIGAALEDVRWDVKAARDKASLLTPMSRFFNDFPWEGAQPEKRKDEPDPMAEEDGEEP